MKDFFKKIRSHAAVAQGDFGYLFRKADIPPLPAAVSRLVIEINSPEPDLDRLSMLISSSPGLAAKLIKTVNSSFYGLRVPVDSVKRAVTLLGIDQVRTLALAFATMDALPMPVSEGFSLTVFWTDALLRGALARNLASKSFSDHLEQSFTVGLLADLALPVLLNGWPEYYTPVFAEYQSDSRSLAEIERQHFGWDHAQAGAWILQSWGFPDELVCCLAFHAQSLKELGKISLDDTLVAPLAVASLLPSVNRVTLPLLEVFRDAAKDWLGFSAAELLHVVGEVSNYMDEVHDLLSLPATPIRALLEELEQCCTAGEGGE